MFDKFFSAFSTDFGIDLGTANTLIYQEGKGVILDEPSVVAIDKSTNEIIAVGHKAKEMLGRTPGKIVAARPMRDGVIADFEIVEKMIRFFLKKVSDRRSFIKPRVVIGVPSGVTEVEKRAVHESCEQAGVREIYIVEEPLVAAIGANMPIEEPTGNMIVDIGGGTTEIAVISLGNLVVEESLRVGGNAIDTAISQYMKKYHNLYIGDRTAETVKIDFLDLWNADGDETYLLRGRDSISGLPRTQAISKIECKNSVEETVGQIMTQIKLVLDKTPPELISDIIDRGIVLTGGGALIRGIKNYVSHETGVPVVVADNPLHSVVIGTGKYLSVMKRMKKNFILNKNESIE